MPILELQQRLRELGRLRMGHRGDKGQPVKSTTWRFTSNSLDLLLAAAAVVGGEPRPWQGAPDEGAYELFGEANSLDVLIPPGQVLTQWLELWSAGGCQRRCDGVTENIQMRPCVCPRDGHNRLVGEKGEACEPHTRLNVILPWVPGLGVWRLETHGWNAAEELSGVAQLLAAAAQQGRSLPASLRIESRTKKRPGEQTRRFIVPVLDVHAMVGQVLKSIGAIADPLRPAPALEPGRRGTQRVPLPSGATEAPSGDQATFEGLQQRPVEPPAPKKQAAKKQAAKKAAAPGYGPTAPPPEAPTGRTPEPPLPAAPVPAEEQAPKTINKAQTQKVVVSCNEAGLDDEGRHDLVGLVTRGRGFSTKDLTKVEMDQVLAICELIQQGWARLEWSADGGCGLHKPDGSRLPMAGVHAWLEAQKGGRADG